MSTHSTFPATVKPGRRRRAVALAALVALATVAAACGDDAGRSDAPTSKAPVGALEGTVKLGFFPNVTHAPALVGVADGLFVAEFGEGVDLQTFTYNSGTEATEALLAGGLDITFIGPNPAINAFAKSSGEAIRIISGSTSGGAFLVVKPEITSVEQLAGTTLATPSLGNTQDVALRSWLKEHGLETTKEGGGDVSILPQSNASTLEAFIGGGIDGAWVPEPWATRLIDEGGGKILVDERDLWPETAGKYVTTHVIVRTKFLKDHPDLVKAVLEALAKAIDSIAADPAHAQAAVVDQIASITGTAPNPEVIAKSFGNLVFTLDPIVASLAGSAADATAVGLLGQVDLTGIYDLTLLNEILTARGEPEVLGI